MRFDTPAFALADVVLNDNNGDFPLVVIGAGEMITRGRVTFVQSGAGIEVTPAAVRLAGLLTLVPADPDTGFSPTVVEFFGGAGQLLPYWTRYQSVLITGDSVVADTGAINMLGDLTVAGDGLYDVGPGDQNVMGDLITQDNGVILMDDPATALSVLGNVTFGGGSTAGRLTDGLLALGRNFTQAGDPMSFNATGGHSVRFANTAGTQQLIAFANPDTAASHFASLELVQGGTPQGVMLQSGVSAIGDFVAPVGVPQQQMIGGGNALTVGGLAVTNALRLEHVLLTWTDSGAYTGSFTAFNAVAFESYNPADTQFSILHSGAGGPTFSMNGLSFDTQPTTGVGYYVKAEDPGDPVNALVVNLGLIIGGADVPDTTEAVFLTHILQVLPATIFYIWS